MMSDIPQILPSLKLTPVAPENWWLEDEVSFWDGPFSGANLLLIFRTIVADAISSDFWLEQLGYRFVYIYIFI